MKKITLVLIALFSLCLLAAAGPKTTTPVVSSIEDMDAATFSPFTIQSDGLGNYYNGIDSVVSFLNGDGDWALNTKSSPVRRFYISYSDPVIPSDPQNNPPISGLVPAQFQAPCSPYRIYLREMLPGQTVTCPVFAISMTYNGETYSLRANSNYPGTDTVQFTCTGANSSGKCNSWAMEPAGVHDGVRKSAMQLIKPPTRPRDRDQFLGMYYMSFKATFVVP